MSITSDGAGAAVVTAGALTTSSGYACSCCWIWLNRSRRASSCVSCSSVCVASDTVLGAACAAVADGTGAAKPRSPYVTMEPSSSINATISGVMPVVSDGTEGAKAGGVGGSYTPDSASSNCCCAVGLTPSSKPSWDSVPTGSGEGATGAGPVNSNGPDGGAGGE